jgi:hypothetical protein
VEKEICCTVMKKVTTKKTICEDQGYWVTREICQPGVMMPSLQWDCCILPRLCMRQGPSIRMQKKEWCPNVVSREVDCVTYVPEIVKKTVKHKVCRYEREEIVEQIPVKTCRWVCSTETYKIPVKTCEWVCETKTKTIKHRTCKMVTEEHTRKIPVRTCTYVKTTKTKRVPYCVSKQVEYTVKKRTARCVPKTVEFKRCHMVCKRVPRIVEYEVCRIVPTTVCCCVGGCATYGTKESAKQHESLKPTPAAEPVPEGEDKKDEAVPSTKPAAPKVKASADSA